MALMIPYALAYDQKETFYSSTYCLLFSSIATAVAVIGSSIACFGPLFRPCTRRPSQDDDEPSPLPERPAHRRPRRSLYELSFPLSSLAASETGKLRPDTLATTVTEICAQQGHDASASKEGLMVDSPRGDSASGPSSAALGIYRTCEVTQVSDVESALEERVHV
ncbi:hypothetical protein BJX61DRAFT_546494 [Aspergillus egyptiacus]|nr:hypothetical protein BJX61DRAFT_546494 [Aspergillus egyptiacus]